MSGLLSVLGLLGLLLALLGLVKGSLRTLGLASRPQCAKAAAVALLVMAVGGALAPEPRPSVDRVAQQEESPLEQAVRPTTPAVPTQTTTPSPPAPPTAAVSAPSPARTTTAVVPLLVMAAGGDGDSWRDTGGIEYRMGLINTPEANECGGAAATAYRKRALAGGFRAKVYATDRYGRQVAVILAPDGVNLNVAMARDGLADDRYLEQFRHENPLLASQLDAAFREARAAGRGIWKTCSNAAPGDRQPGPAQAPQPIAGGRCHPDYETCIPVQGNGSGRGAANDLDCGDIGHPVRLREVGRDPYRLDGSDRDGLGCE